MKTLNCFIFPGIFKIFSGNSKMSFLNETVNKDLYLLYHSTGLIFRSFLIHDSPPVRFHFMSVDFWRISTGRSSNGF